MQQKPHPETLGVFAPVDHVVISFPTAQDMEAAAAELGSRGFGGEKIIRYTPAEMKAQAEQDLANVNPLADLGQEANLVRAHRDLAEKGYSFLMVHAPQSEQATVVTEVARRFHAERAQKYGTFVIEELIQPSGEEDQVFESPARGLD
jgi:hypothetical protein